MTFALIENSEQSGQPVLLFKFFRTGKSWFYTNVDQPITFNGDTYLAAPITADTFTQSGLAADNTYKITTPATIDFAVYLDTISPTTEIMLNVRKIHMLQSAVDGTYTPPTLADAPIVWIGSLQSLGRPTVGSREMTFTALTIARGGLRLSWASTCPHMLYDRGCTLKPENFSIGVVAITIVDGITISAPEFGLAATDYFTAGFLEWQSSPGVVEKRGFEQHTGSTITLFGTTDGIVGGTNFKAHPGCLRIPDVCNLKFGNMVNYGGINHLIGRSPFDGNPIF